MDEMNFVFEMEDDLLYNNFRNLDGIWIPFVRFPSWVVPKLEIIGGMRF